MAQTSDRVSSIAARYSGITAEEIIARAARKSSADVLVKDIRAMASSVLRQDETRGLRRFLRKAFG